MLPVCSLCLSRIGVDDAFPGAAQICGQDSAFGFFTISLHCGHFAELSPFQNSMIAGQWGHFTSNMSSVLRFCGSCLGHFIFFSLIVCHTFLLFEYVAFLPVVGRARHAVPLQE